MMTANEIREIFLDFFRSKQHTIIPSAPMVIKNDPTLMFTNAGMNQFKDIFLGNEPAKHKRVADSQKCLRVSGKHNDLEEVGHDTYHHTMFEMLGNWSFGDYFKKEAISWAWELLVEVYKLPADRIYATVFEGNPDENVPFDQEAYNMWAKYLPKERILKGDQADNFWEMGEVGPCGPCSEIHFDLRDDRERKLVDGATLVNKSDPQVIEIWNLVFMQYNRKFGGLLEPLPAKHVDTGMGFERLCMVIQGKKSSYDTDVFQPLLKKIGSLSNFSYGEDTKTDIAMRVIADHLRTICFSIADGQLPSNVKAGYVIRRILRRAVRYAYTYLNVREPFLTKLVPTLVEQMGAQFTELKTQQKFTEKIIFEEENSFLKTLETGISLLDKLIYKSKEISGKDAFVLYDTYGFPIDLTELIARENGVCVNLDDFHKELDAQKERSRNAAVVENQDWTELRSIIKSEFVGYDLSSIDIKIARFRCSKTKNRTLYQLVFDQTPFYGNSGGQVGETGYIESNSERIPIIDTIKENNLTIHVVENLPADPSANFVAVVDIDRRMASAANHSATHILHHVLREVLGTHVEQKGSLVAPEYLRFDFSHFQKVTQEEIRKIERRVNELVRASIPIEENRNCSMDNAKDMGAIMLFGEKYEDSVRVIKFGNSIELCGGIHVKNTGNIGIFKISSEGSSAAGIRRIEAITALRSEELWYSQEDILLEFAKALGTTKFRAGLLKIREENAEMARQLDIVRVSRDNFLIKELSNDSDHINMYKLISRRLDLIPDSIKYIAYELRNNIKDCAVVLGSHSDGKPSLTIALSDSLVSLGLNAGAIIREAAKAMDGGGGGQPGYATAGGKNPDGLNAAIDVAKSIIKEKLR